MASALVATRLRGLVGARRVLQGTVGPRGGLRVALERSSRAFSSSFSRGDGNSMSSSAGKRKTSVEDTELQEQQSSFLRDVDLRTAVGQQKLSKIVQDVATAKANSGDFIPHLIIRHLCTHYRGMDIDEKKHFLLILARDLHVDTNTVMESIDLFRDNLRNVQDSDGEVDWKHEHIERYLRTYRNLASALTPLHETFFKKIVSQRDGGMLFLVKMRADLQQVLRKYVDGHAEVSALRSLDANLKEFLAAWFSVGFLNLERVTYEHSSGQLLEKIIRYEAVHPVGTVVELKRRLGNGRRCFAFFHPSIPDEPLVFVHVALVKDIATSMQYIRDETEQLTDDSCADAAIFYSISSTQKGLSGIDLGNFLIKEVAKSLKEELPQLRTYATLSPLPQFMSWLETQRHKNDEDHSLVDVGDLEALRNIPSVKTGAQSDETPVSTVLRALEIDQWFEDEALQRTLQPIVLRLGARYIYLEKKRCKAFDPVANFHIRNGAIFERINWLADVSKKGLAQSAGLMVNYKYDLSLVESNNENYLLHNVIPIGVQPQQVLGVGELVDVPEC